MNVVIVPLRGGDNSKSRLAPVADAEVRTLLVRVLARHVISVLLDVPEIAHIIVVTADPTFAAGTSSGLGTTLGTALGTDRLAIVDQGAAHGLNTALDKGRDAARDWLTIHADDGSQHRLLIIHADLPIVDGDDIRAVLDDAANVTIATDREGLGTNVLALDPRGDFRFQFGPQSCVAHQDEAYRRRRTVRTLTRPGTAADLDSIADWLALPMAARRGLVHEHPKLAVLDAARKQ